MLRRPAVGENGMNRGMPKKAFLPAQRSVKFVNQTIGEAGLGMPCLLEMATRSPFSLVFRLLQKALHIIMQSVVHTAADTFRERHLALFTLYPPGATSVLFVVNQFQLNASLGCCTAFW